jgi:hypothetical protein
MTKYYYVYYSYEPWGRGYIGKRECDCPPERDVYFGSFYDKTFCPTEKIILQQCSSREEALEAEIILHSFFQVDKNPHFANQARQTSVGFQGGSGFLGFNHSEDSKQKISQNSASRSPEFREAMSKRLKGVPKSKEHRENISKGLKGKNRTPMSEETKQKISDANMGKTLSADHRKKISLANKNKPRTEKQIQAVIESNKRRKGEKRLGYHRHED